MSENTWMPIESAPEDGTVVLAVCADAQYPSARIAWWDGKGWVRLWKPEKFVVDGHSRWWPTHWQPVPDFVAHTPSIEQASS